MQRLFPSNTFVAPFVVPGDRLCIAEAPGAVEAERGQPLVGPSGSWLRGREVDGGKRSGGLYKAAGVDESTVSRANCIQCQPPKNVFPTDPDARVYITKEDANAAIKHCHSNHVVPLLHSRKWGRVDILGDKALSLLTGQEGILRWRGSPLAIPVLGPEPVAVPTIHPAAIARNQELLPAVVKDLAKTLVRPPEHYDISPSIETLRNFQATEFAFDIETVRATGEITMVGLAAESFKALCVPAKGLYLDELRRIFQRATAVVGHNSCQFDLPRLRDVNINISENCTVWDTMLMQHLLQPDLPHSLAFLGSFFTNKPAWKHLSGADEATYCCRDVDVTWQCFQQLRPSLVHEGLMDLYQNVQVPLARICSLFHDQGFKIDPTRIVQVRADLAKQSKELEGLLPEGLRTRDLAIRKRVPAPAGTLSPKTGRPLKYLMAEATELISPWKSNELLKVYFYETRSLAVQTHAKTDRPTVDKTALPKLLRAAQRPAYGRDHGEEVVREVLGAIRAIQALRVIASLESTFVKEAFLGIERIHASFNVHGTASGRLSSSDPNLQNIPESARYIYVPSHSGWSIFDVDFSSLENRLTAWFAQDFERLERLSKPGFNEHKWTCSQFFDIPLEDVVKDNSKDAPYGKAKRIGHGSNYGMGPLKISRLYDLDFAEVKVLTDKWREVNKVTVAWQQTTAAQAAKDGFLTTPFGRKRYFYTDSKYTESLSFLPQSAGADIMFRAMIALMYERVGWPETAVQKLVDIYEPLPKPFRMLVSVHDSLVFEGPTDQGEELVRVVTRVMTQGWKELGGFSIPIDVKRGPSWGEAA